jgi:hypothetical protein
MEKISRRQLGLVGSLAWAFGQTACAQLPATPPGRPPRDVGVKFNADGSVKEFIGSTFVGHVGQQGEDFAVFDTLLNIYREFPTLPFASKVALLPPSSYHVTVFVGLNEPDRNTPRWPAGVADDLSQPAATQKHLSLLRAQPRLNNSVFEFEMGDPPPLRIEGAPNIPLRPADAATARRLAAVRNDLAQLTGIRRPDHDSYQYHLTIGYIHQYLSAGEAQALQAANIRWMKSLAALPRRLRINNVQFCSLRDMYAFQVLHEM